MKPSVPDGWVVMITCVDLYCGVGGLTHGLTRGGIRVVAGFDVDEACRYPYEANNKAKFINKGVETLSMEDLRGHWRRGGSTLLARCAPCQPFSCYSRAVRKGRKATDETRWDLLGAFGRLVRRESADLGDNGEHCLKTLQITQFLRNSLLHLAGIKSGTGSWNARDTGVPQTRKRLVLLASRLGPVALLPPDDREVKVTVREAISHLPRLPAGGVDPNDRLHSACRLDELNLRRIRASKPGGTWRDWDSSLITRCHQKPSGSSYPSIYGRMEWDMPAPTMTTQCFGYGSGRFGHPEQDRAISLREAAILQTFPQSYRFVREDEPVRFSILGRLIGNAVPVRLGEIVAKTLVRHVREHSQRARRAIPKSSSNAPSPALK